MRANYVINIILSTSYVLNHSILKIALEVGINYCYPILRMRNVETDAKAERRYVCVCVLSCSVVSDCDPMECSPPGSSVHGDSPGKNTGMGCHVLLQGIFPTQGSNLGLPHCR